MLEQVRGDFIPRQMSRVRVREQMKGHVKKGRGHRIASDLPARVIRRFSLSYTVTFALDSSILVLPFFPCPAVDEHEKLLLLSARHGPLHR